MGRSGGVLSELGNGWNLDKIGEALDTGYCVDNMGCRDGVHVDIGGRDVVIAGHRLKIYVTNCACTVESVNHLGQCCRLGIDSSWAVQIRF